MRRFLGEPKRTPGVEKKKSEDASHPHVTNHRGRQPVRHTRRTPPLQPLVPLPHHITRAVVLRDTDTTT